jgi:hypothetical protein
MEREKLYELLHRRPFQPFCLQLADGRTFEVRFPEINLLGQSYIKIGILEPNDTDLIPDHLEYVPLAQIIRAEPLPTAVPPSEC